MKFPLFYWLLWMFIYSIGANPQNFVLFPEGPCSLWWEFCQFFSISSLPRIFFKIEEYVEFNFFCFLYCVCGLYFHEGLYYKSNLQIVGGAAARRFSTYLYNCILRFYMTKTTVYHFPLYYDARSQYCSIQTILPHLMLVATFHRCIFHL